MSRAPEGLAVVCVGGGGMVAVPVGGGRARADLEIDRSEPSGSRVAISRAGRRPPAHTAARPIQASHAAAGNLAGHNRHSPGRLLHNSPHGSSPRRPWHICHDVRPVASHARSYRLGRGGRARCAAPAVGLRHVPHWYRAVLVAHGGSDARGSGVYDGADDAEAAVAHHD